MIPEAALATEHHYNHDHQKALQLLTNLKPSLPRDHNIALAQHLAQPKAPPHELLKALRLLQTDQARKHARAQSNADADASATNADAPRTLGTSDADGALLSYNAALLLYQTKQYGSARLELEELFANIEPIDEFLTFKLCFLLLDVLLLHRQTDKARDVLARAERAYAELLSNGDESNREQPPAEWPERRSARPPPTHISPAEVCSSLAVYKAKLALASRAPEAQSAVGACAHGGATGVILKANHEYLRRDYRKAIKLLSHSCRKSEADPGLRALYFANMGCVHHCMRRHHAAAFYFVKALQMNGEQQAAAPRSPLHCDRSAELEYNHGLQLLLGGQPATAFASLHASLRLLHHQPRAWLRAAEACIAAHMQREEAALGNDAGSLIAGAIGAGPRRRLVVSAGAAAASRQQPSKADGEKQRLERSEGNAKAPAPTLAYAITCLRNALHLCELHGGASSGVDYAALLAASRQHANALPTGQRMALAAHSLHRLALLKLCWCHLTLADHAEAMRTLEPLLDSDGPPQLRVHAHLYACYALCHLGRLAEAEQHAASALPLSDWLADVVPAPGGAPDDGQLEEVTNPYASASPAAARCTLFSNMAAVHALRGADNAASDCIRHALELQPKSRHALLTHVYLELRAGRSGEALEAITRQCVNV